MPSLGAGHASTPHAQPASPARMAGDVTTTPCDVDLIVAYKQMANTTIQNLSG
jgi:hypothetical protein